MPRDAPTRRLAAARSPARQGYAAGQALAQVMVHHLHGLLVEVDRLRALRLIIHVTGLRSGLDFKLLHGVLFCATKLQPCIHAGAIERYCPRRRIAHARLDGILHAADSLDV